MTTPDPTTTVTDPNKTGTQTEPTEVLVNSKTAKQWHEAYAGLQTTYNKLKETTDGSIADLKGQLETAGKDRDTFKNQVSQFETEKTTLQKQIDELNTNLGTEKDNTVKATQKLDRLNLLVTKFPGLAEWEAKGLLPSRETIEDLEKAFTDFQASLGTQVGKQVKSTLEGASPEGIVDPTSQTTQVTETEDYLWNKLVEISKRQPFASKDREEYDATQAKYDALIAAKAKQK